MEVERKLDRNTVDMTTDASSDSVVDRNVSDTGGREIDITTDKASTTTIIGKDGNMVEVDTVFQKGLASARSRDRKLKKKSIRKYVLIPKGERTMKPGKTMKRVDLSKWIEKPYSIKDKLGATISGPSKRGYGFVLVNGGLYCNLCETTVVQKPTQHLSEKNTKINIRRRKISSYKKRTCSQ